MNLTNIKKLKPQLKASSLSGIDLQKLRDAGKKGIILDLDNTITLWKDTAISKEAHEFIEQALKLGFSICLLSNAKKSRTANIAAIYNLPFVSMAKKPMQNSYIRALAMLELKADAVIAVGDQVFTDILGGNRAGCYTILVPPLGTREFIWTKFMRQLEKLVE